MIRFIDEHKDRRSGELRWGIEPIASILGIAPSTYHAAKTRPPSARAIRDAELRPEIRRVWEDNLSVYGADKVWDQLNRDGLGVARCTVERLMRQMGLQGCRRGRVFVRTTEAYVRTHTGWVYVAFIIDVFSRMVVGWQASRSLRADLAIDALEMAVHNRSRDPGDLDGLVILDSRIDHTVEVRSSRCG